MLSTKGLVLKTAVVLSLVFSFGFSAGGRVFADDPSTGTTDNTAAATTGSDQTATTGPATDDGSASQNPTGQPDTTPPTSGDPTAATDSTPAPTTDTTDNNNAPTTDGNNDSNGSNGSSSDSTTPPTCPSTTDPSTTDPSADPSNSGDPSSGNTTNNTGTINNNDCAAANSGDASVTGNANGGDATSGDASNMATIVNIIQSLTGLSGAQLATFIDNIGDHTGDITIDPALLDYLNSSACGCGGNASINNNGTINNNINQSANSGNADVSNNGSGGNATTGDASNVLNLINIINSVIAAQKSFIGIININGNLDGDILLPPDLLNSLYGSSPPSGSGSGGGSSLDVNNTEGINNNITQTAASGDATVSDNGSGGNATSGNALNKLTLLNLTGSEVIGSDAILVIVNVLGQWFGMIVNAPAGATSAALGDGTSSGIPCGCRGSDLNVNNNAQINNNIVQTAQSGNATVTGNGSGGNATSGNASNSANIINIINSDLSLNGWFGILIINVFGSWTGSFGIDTAAGNPPVQPTSGGQGSAPAVSQAVATTTGGGNNGYGAGNSQTTNDNTQTQNTKVLGDSTGGGSNTLLPKAGKLPNMVVGAISALCCFLALGIVERRQNRRQAAAAMPAEVITPGFSLNNYQQ